MLVRLKEAGVHNPFAPVKCQRRVCFRNYTRMTANKGGKELQMALPMLTQTELTEELAEETGWSKSDVRRFLEGLGTVIQNNVSEGYRVKVAGIQVEPVLKKATKKRKGRNPATGEDVMIPAKPASTKLRAKIVNPLKGTKLPSTKKLQGMM